MKKFTSLLLIAIMIMNFAACGNTTSSNNNPSEVEQSSSQSSNSSGGGGWWTPSKSENSNSKEEIMDNYASDKSANSYISSMGLGGKVGEMVNEYEANWINSVFDTHNQIFNIYRDAELCKRYNDQGLLLYWFSEYVGKMLVSCVTAYKVSGSEETKKTCEDLIANIKSIQRDDGYVGPFPADYKTPYASDPWGHYFIIVGMCEWYELTGDKAALDVAIGAADFIYNSNISQTTGKFYSIETGAMNVSMVHGFTLIYEHTQDPKYYEAAKHMINVSWTIGGDWFNNAIAGKEYFETTSKRWECMHALLAIGEMYRITGDEKYYQAMDQIWWSLLKTDVHNTGGWTTNEIVTGNPYNKGTIETCCTIAWMAFSKDYLKISKNSYVADELERSYFNGMLGSIVDGTYVTYGTNMDSPWGRGRSNATSDPTKVVHECPDFTCCTCNGGRGVNFIADWGVMSDKSALYLNYFGASDIHTLTPSGKNISINQETIYPQNGSIKITLSLNDAETFALNVRIPSWAGENTTLKVNSEAVTVKPGEYAVISREWKNGDTLELDIDMTVHFLVGEKDCVNLTSAYYGPILMTLDRASFSGDFFDTQFTADALKEVVVSDGGDKYWLKFTAKDTSGNDITLVDFASAGRGTSAYESWLNVDHNMLVLTTAKGETPTWLNTQAEGKKLLGDLIAAAKIKDLSIYTENSVSAVNSALVTAETVFANESATDSDISSAADTLHSALFSLVKDYSNQMTESEAKNILVTLTKDSFSKIGDIIQESHNGIKITGTGQYWAYGDFPAVTYKAEKLSLNGLNVGFTIDNYPGTKNGDPFVAIYITENPGVSAWGVTQTSGDGYLLIIPISNTGDTTAKFRGMKINECAQDLYLASAPSPNTKVGNIVNVQFKQHETLGYQILINGQVLENASKNRPFDLTPLCETFKDGTAYVSLAVIMGVDNVGASVTWTSLSVK